MKPVAAHHIKFLGHSDQGGKGDGVQVMVHRGHAYIGHGFSNGITVIDVREPRKPKVVNFIACPPNTRAIHLQTHEDLLLAVNGPSVWTMKVSEQEYFSGNAPDKLKQQGAKFTAGLRIYNLKDPASPREIGFMPVEGIGPHRLWYTGGRYAYMSNHFPDTSDHILAVVDVSDPTKPSIAGRWWIPGMWSGGGEKPGWKSGGRYALHHMLVAGNLGYGAWRDGGMTILDLAEPTKPKLVVHRNWDPPFGGGTHSPLPLPDRNLLVIADEANFSDCSKGLRYIWVFDVREPGNPVSISTFPQPEEADYCAKGGNYGPHNLHENRPGSFQSSRIIFATFQNAGVRAYDIDNPFRPREIAYYVPPDPEKMMDPRPGRAKVIQSADVYVDAQGVMYVTDSNGGLNILQFEG